MKYSEAMIPKTIPDLRLAIATVKSPDDDRQWYEPDFDGRYYEIEQGIENLRKRLGEAKADQVLDMVHQSKTHFLHRDKLGYRLLQDAEMVVAGRPVLPILSDCIDGQDHRKTPIQRPRPCRHLTSTFLTSSAKYKITFMSGQTAIRLISGRRS